MDKTNPNGWSARDRSREASNDYYQKDRDIPMNGYDDGEVSTHIDDYTKIESAADMEDSQYSKAKGDSFDDMSSAQDIWPKGIESEDSMDGYLTKNDSAIKK